MPRLSVQLYRQKSNQFISVLKKCLNWLPVVASYRAMEKETLLDQHTLTRSGDPVVIFYSPYTLLQCRRKCYDGLSKSFVTSFKAKTYSKPCQTSKIELFCEQLKALQKTPTQASSIQYVRKNSPKTFLLLDTRTQLCDAQQRSTNNSFSESLLSH